LLDINAAIDTQQGNFMAGGDILAFGDKLVIDTARQNCAGVAFLHLITALL